MAWEPVLVREWTERWRHVLELRSLLAPPMTGALYRTIFERSDKPKFFCPISGNDFLSDSPVSPSPLTRRRPCLMDMDSAAADMSTSRLGAHV